MNENRLYSNKNGVCFGHPGHKSGPAGSPAAEPRQRRVLEQTGSFITGESHSAGIKANTRCKHLLTFLIFATALPNEQLSPPFALTTIATIIALIHSSRRLLCNCFPVQLRAARYEVHDIFFSLSAGERMELISWDRELAKKRALRRQVTASRVCVCVCVCVCARVCVCVCV